MTRVRALPPVYSRVRVRDIVRATGDAINHSEALPAQVDALLRTAWPARRAILTDSGTHALVCAMRMLGVSNGSIVALPAYVCPDVAAAALYLGARIALYDISPDTLQPDELSLRWCLERGAGVVVACHLYGLVIDVPAVVAQCSPFGARVLEDAAQHAGARTEAGRAGGDGEVAILSFGRGKGLNAAGGGAVLVSESAQGVVFDHDSRERGLLGLISLAAEQLLTSPRLYPVVQRLPLGIGLTAFHPATEPRRASWRTLSLLHSALRAEAEELARRRALATRYRESLGAHARFIKPRDGTEDGALRVPVRLERAPSGTAQSLGVTRSYPCTLAKYKEIVPSLLSEQPAAKGSEELARTLWTLPTHCRVTEPDQQRIIDALL